MGGAIARLIERLRPGPLSSLEATRQSELVHATAAVLLLAAPAMVAFVAHTGLRLGWLAILVGLGSMLAAVVLARRGRVRLASVCVVAGIWLGSVLGLVGGEALAHGAAARLMLPVALAGLLLGALGTALTAAASAAGYLGVLLASPAGEAGFASEQLVPWAIYSGSFFVMAALIGLATGRMRRAARDAEASRAQLAQFLDHQPLGVIGFDDQFDINRVNQPYLDAIGATSPDQLIGRNLLEGDFYRAAGVREDVARCLAEQVPFRREVSFRTIAGRDVSLRIHADFVRDESGRVTGGQAIVEDISEQLATQRALAGSEARYRALAENSTDLVLLLDAEGRLLYVNSAAKQILGEMPGLGRGALEGDAMHPDDLSIILANHQRVLSTGSGALERPFRWRHRDGSWRWMEGAGRVISNEDGTRPDPSDEHFRIVVNLRDVTARIALEEELRQAQKLEAVGQLAGGVAHDFNNLLTVITGYASGLEDSPHLADEDREAVREVLTAADRASALTQQLLTFSRRERLEPRPLDLGKVLVGLREMLARLIGTHIDFSIELGDALPAVFADEGRIEQVIVNLVINARDAMPEGGALRISLAAVERGEPLPRVLLRVDDTGSGMSRETRERIFEPFFTTKEAGRGTGLGLSTVYGIVQAAGGEIHVESAPGRGTRISIELPGSAVRSEAPNLRPALAVGGGSETLLLVEDEPGVRALSQAALEAAGYRVLVAEDGAAALELASGYPDPIDLVVSDVVMPKLSGPKLVDELRHSRPDFALLYITGYDRIEQDDAIPGRQRMQKPFTPSELRARVREVLDAAPSGAVPVSQYVETPAVRAP